MHGDPAAATPRTATRSRRRDDGRGRDRVHRSRRHRHARRPAHRPDRSVLPAVPARQGRGQHGGQAGRPPGHRDPPLARPDPGARQDRRGPVGAGAGEEGPPLRGPGLVGQPGAPPGRCRPTSPPVAPSTSCSTTPTSTGASDRRMRFVADNLVAALAPSNTPLLNPAALKAALDTGGSNYVDGAPPARQGHRDQARASRRWSTRTPSRSAGTSPSPRARSSCAPGSSS